MSNWSKKEAATHFKVSASTITRWEKSGKLTADKTPGGRKRYAMPANPMNTPFDRGNNFLNESPFLNNISTIKETPTGNFLEYKIPPGGGTIIVPAAQQYAGLINAFRHFYLNPDEAIRNSRTNARNMMRNLSIRTPLQARMLATAELEGHVEPEDKTDPEQLKVASEIQNIIDCVPYFLKYKYALLYAIWFGRFAVINNFYWDWRKSFKRLMVKDWTPVQGDSLEFKYTSEDVGILVGIFTGAQGTKKLSTQPTDVSRAHVLGDTGMEGGIRQLAFHEREALVLHQHELMPGDFFEAESAGGVKGLGIRSVLYWTWYLQNELTGWLIELMERIGTGLTIIRYIRNNSESYNAAKAIAESESFQGVLLFPKDPSDPKSTEDIERIEPSPVGVDNLLKVLDDYFGGQIRRYIQGQDATSHPTTSGMNSGVGQQHGETFHRIVKFDAINLQETITRDLVSVIQKWTFPETRFYCTYKLVVDKNDPMEWMSAAKNAFEMGADLDEEQVRSVLGLNQPQQGDKVLSKMAQQAFNFSMNPNKENKEKDNDE